MQEATTQNPTASNQTRPKPTDPKVRNRLLGSLATLIGIIITLMTISFAHVTAFQYFIPLGWVIGPSFILFGLLGWSKLPRSDVYRAASKLVLQDVKRQKSSIVRISCFNIVLGAALIVLNSLLWQSNLNLGLKIFTGVSFGISILFSSLALIVMLALIIKPRKLLHAYPKLGLIFTSKALMSVLTSLVTVLATLLWLSAPTPSPMTISAFALGMSTGALPVLILLISFLPLGRARAPVVPTIHIGAVPLPTKHTADTAAPSPNQTAPKPEESLNLFQQLPPAGSPHRDNSRIGTDVERRASLSPLPTVV